jgi:glycosyltransferase involved in cell wall biosynthesis
MKRKILWVGDAGCDSGFAKATHYTLGNKPGEGLSTTYDCYVEALNYRGDGNIARRYPHLTMYPSWVAGGDLFGVRRIRDLVIQIRPDVIVIQQDPWNFNAYLEEVKDIDIPVVGIVALDGYNMMFSPALNRLDRIIWWQKFAQEEGRKAGVTTPSAVIGLGVDRSIFKPGDRMEARKRIGLPDDVINGFIVGNVNRNQPRKRMDLTVKYFADWVNARSIRDAYLYLHVAPTGDQGYQCDQLAKYYGVNDRMIYAEPQMWKSTPEHWVVTTMQAFDVLVSTTQGEGMGLTTLEAMACGIPCIVPDWSALGEWAKPGAWMVPCDNISVTPRANVIGGVPSQDEFIHALETLYVNTSSREKLAQKGLALSMEPQFNWKLIADAVARELEAALLKL